MTGKYRISYTPAAYADLGDIYSYIAFALKEKRIASNLVRRIRQEISSLRTFPERCSAVDWEPWASMGMRKLTVSHHVVYYQVNTTDQTVTVIRIFYGGRDVEHIVREEQGQTSRENESES